MEQKPLEIIAKNAGERLDKLVQTHLSDLSRTQIQTLIKSGAVTVDGQSVKPGIKLKGGEQIIIQLPTESEFVIEPEAIELDIRYEDDDIAVINKLAGMVVHPGVGHESGTLVHALLHHYPQIQAMTDYEQSEGRMGIAHRLDKDTSGLIVIAKHIDALENLMVQFKERMVDKTYIALLEREPDTSTGRIDAAIGRDKNQRKRMAVRHDGKPAITEYEVVDNQFHDGQALVKVKLLTGRTHQIRVHMAFIRCPVVGDSVYGYRKQRIKMKRHFLHAAELKFDHPQTGEPLHFESDLDLGLQNILQKLR